MDAAQANVRTTRASEDDPCMQHLVAVFDANERLAREDPAAYAAKMYAQLPVNHCAMCRVEYRGYGNSAQPILDGDVCDDCNASTVMRARWRRKPAPETA